MKNQALNLTSCADSPRTSVGFGNAPDDTLTYARRIGNDRQM
jgi:hypothetical protein